jgi:hypothetical protein
MFVWALYNTLLFSTSQTFVMQTRKTERNTDNSIHAAAAADNNNNNNNSFWQIGQA